MGRFFLCPGPELNRHDPCGSQDFKSGVSTNFTTMAPDMHIKKNPPPQARGILERKTGLEPATPTLARSCSTK
jgi:hypothetical protein